VVGSLRAHIERTRSRVWPRLLPLVHFLLSIVRHDFRLFMIASGGAGPGWPGTVGSFRADAEASHTPGRRRGRGCCLGRAHHTSDSAAPRTRPTHHHRSHAPPQARPATCWSRGTKPGPPPTRPHSATGQPGTRRGSCLGVDCRARWRTQSVPTVPTAWRAVPTPIRGQISHYKSTAYDIFSHLSPLSPRKNGLHPQWALQRYSRTIPPKGSSRPVRPLVADGPLGGDGCTT
jgi:hypothetical protein